MNLLNRVTDMARSPGDPKILQTGPSSLTAPDRLARGLGWFSLALGAVELMAPGHITRTLGLEGKEALVRAYGAREVASGAQLKMSFVQVEPVAMIFVDTMPTLGATPWPSR